jgi:hypothetical protein
MCKTKLEGLFSNLGSEYAVMGTIMPGAKLDITNLAKRELVTLTKKDSVIIWGRAPTMSTKMSH